MSNSLWPQWTAAQQIALSSTISQSLLKFTCTESVMLSNHLILCHTLLILPSIFLSIRIFSNESALCIRWPKYWSFSFSPSNEYSGLISFRIDWFDFLAVQGILNSFLQHHNWKASILWHSAFFIVQLSHPYMMRWSTPKSDWLYSLQPKRKNLYTVNKNKTRSWLWLRPCTPYCQIQTQIEESRENH